MGVQRGETQGEEEEDETGGGRPIKGAEQEKKAEIMTAKETFIL